MGQAPQPDYFNQGPAQNFGMMGGPPAPQPQMQMPGPQNHMMPGPGGQGNLPGGPNIPGPNMNQGMPGPMNPKNDFAELPMPGLEPAKPQGGQDGAMMFPPPQNAPGFPNQQNGQPGGPGMSQEQINQQINQAPDYFGNDAEQQKNQQN